MLERINPARAISAGDGRRLRVLMTTDTVGGVFTYVVDLCRGLRRHDVEIILVTMGAPLTDAQNAALAALPHVQVCESCYRLEWMEEPWREVDAAGDWLLQLATRYRPDVIHLNGYAHGALPWAAPVLVVGHSCVLSWWRAVKGEDAPAAWHTYRRRVAAGLRSADLIAAPTRAMLAALDRLYGPLAATRVIHNGRAPGPFRADARKRPLVFSAGRMWDEAKNLAALEACQPRLPWPVYVAGPTRPPGGRGESAGHDAGECAGRAPPGAHGVRLLGRLTPEVMAAWLARAAIYAAPARYEPFGLSVLEAALSGCALVLGDIDSLRELWDGAAVFVPPDDPEALGRAICELVAQGPRRMRLVEEAHARALHHTPAHMARSYLGAYEDLLRGHAHPLLPVHRISTDIDRTSYPGSPYGAAIRRAVNNSVYM